MNQLYVVCTYEIHRQDVLVAADSPEDAIDRASRGEGEDDGPAEFVERMDITECSAKPQSVWPDAAEPREVHDAR